MGTAAHKESLIGTRVNVNAAMRARTGNVTDARALVSFFYELLRDTVPLGTIEALVQRVELEDPVRVYTNGHLARYAQDLADRLTAPIDQSAPEGERYC